MPCAMTVFYIQVYIMVGQQNTGEELLYHLITCMFVGK